MTPPLIDPNLMHKKLPGIEVLFWVSFFQYPQILRGETPNLDAKLAVDASLKLLDEFLQDTEFITGNKPTIADCSIVGSVTLLSVIDYDFNAYKNVQGYIERVKKLNGYDEAFNEGLNSLKEILMSHKPKN